MRAELKLVPPKPGRTPFWYIRGTYLRTYVERSAGTTDKAVARKVLIKIRSDIEKGLHTVAAGPTWLSAVDGYLDHNPNLGSNDQAFLRRLSAHLGAMPLDDLDQARIDHAALDLLPDASPATRNREVYTPISAVLRHAGVALLLKRPKGAQGKQRKNWLRPEVADALLSAAWETHPRFAALLTLLLYCGCRLSEALRIQIEEVHLDLGFIDVPDTKNEEPQRMHLPPIAVQAVRLALMQPANATYRKQELPRTKGSLFCLTKSSALYKIWNEVKVKAQTDAGVTLPSGVAFHLLRHTFGAWTRHAGGRLEETGRWTSRAGAKPYDHYNVTEAQRISDRFPGADGLTPVLRNASDVKR